MNKTLRGAISILILIAGLGVIMYFIPNFFFSFLLAIEGILSLDIMAVAMVIGYIWIPLTILLALFVFWLFFLKSPKQEYQTKNRILTKKRLFITPLTFFGLGGVLSIIFPIIIDVLFRLPISFFLVFDRSKGFWEFIGLDTVILVVASILLLLAVSWLISGIATTAKKKDLEV